MADEHPRELVGVLGWDFYDGPTIDGQAVSKMLGPFNDRFACVRLVIESIGWVPVAIAASADLDSVTVDEWRVASDLERRAFIDHWRRIGVVAMACLGCGFPSARGRSTCDGCNPEDLERSRQRMAEFLNRTQGEPKVAQHD